MNGKKIILSAVYSPSLKLAASEFVYEFSEQMRVSQEAALLEEEHSLASEIYMLYNKPLNLIERFKAGEELLTCRGVRVRLASSEVVILRLKNRLPFPFDFSYIELSSIGSAVEFNVQDLMSRYRLNMNVSVSNEFVHQVSQIADSSHSLKDFYQVVERLSPEAKRAVTRIKAQKEMTLAALLRREPIV